MIYSKDSGFPDPYLEFNMGKSVFVSMRNMFKPSTNTPMLYRYDRVILFCWTGHNAEFEHAHVILRREIES